MSVKRSVGEESSTESEEERVVCEEPRKKKIKNELSTPPQSSNHFAKPSVKQLIKFGESFLQDGPCFKVAPKLMKCMQCVSINKKSYNTVKVSCRFYGFRLLRYTKKGNLALAGFSDPHRHASQDDLQLWLPMPSNPPADLDATTAKYLLEQVGEVFCDLLKQEKEAISIHMSDDKTVAWKRVIQGIRLMCDVCITALFNFHWVCCRCGFSVCIDCYKGRKYGRDNILGDLDTDLDHLPWTLCTNRKEHKQEALKLTQIIAGDSLTTLGLGVHEACATWNIPIHCGCPLVSQVKPTCVISEKSGSSSNSNENRKYSAMKRSGLKECPVVPGKGPVKNDGLWIPMGCTGNFVLRCSWKPKGKDRPPICMFRRFLSKYLYKNVPHSWSSRGKLLQLEEPYNPGNYKFFYNQLKRGEPLMVRNLAEHLNMDLWHPDSFIRDFGERKNALINVIADDIVPNQLMCIFWEGFENFSKRLDERGNKMLLKLKDWPPGEDFAKMLPSRFDDLMKVLPLGEYSQQSGRLNLASRLPDCCVHPDLGPNMCAAYGPVSNANKGSTNLHLHTTDTVNVMVHVGIPTHGDYQNHVMKEVSNVVEEESCKIRLRKKLAEGKLPGAVWRIFAAKDANMIRDFLNRVDRKRGTELGSHYDPIRDQRWYLDQPLRKQLYKSYYVKSYVIIQCLGDAIFIPAGAPHQVRNLHSCIKVSESFVSPENVADSFRFLYTEARKFYYNHRKYEGKLQLKNIIYHTVKDAVSTLATYIENTDVPEFEKDDLVNKVHEGCKDFYFTVFRKRCC